MQRGVYGTNAISFKFKDGVITGIDTGVCYGNLSMENVQRLEKLTDDCLIAFSGLLSDIQFLKRLLRKELELDDQRKMDPQGIHKMIQRILYSKRSEGEPLTISVIVSGVNLKENRIFETTDENGRMIGVVNSKGNFWFDESVALSFSSHLILPILRERNLNEMTREEAIALIEDCFKILCYKDCQATNRIQIGISELNKVEIQEPYCISTDWSIGVNEGEIIL